MQFKNDSSPFFFATWEFAKTEFSKRKKYICKNFLPMLFWLCFYFDWKCYFLIEWKHKTEEAWNDGNDSENKCNIKWKHLFNRTQFPVSTPLFGLNKIQRSISIRTHSVKDKLYCLLLVHKVKEWLKSWECNLFSAFELILWIRKDKYIR